MVLSQVNKRKLICLNKFDLDSMCSLLGSGFNLNETLTLIETEKNKEVIKLIKKDLNQGKSIQEALNHRIAVQYNKHFNSLLEFIPLDQTLQLCNRFDDFEQKTKGLLQKNLFQPLVLFFSSIVAVECFNQIGFPILIQLMREFKVSVSTLTSVHILLSSSIRFLFVILFFLTIGILYFSQKDKRVIGYLLLKKFGIGHILCHLISTEFATYFNECTKLDFKTQISLQILQKLKQKPLLVFLSYHTEQLLIQGNEMDKAMDHGYLDQQLISTMKLAMHIANVCKMLDSYIEINQTKSIVFCMKLSKWIRMFSYSFVGFMIIMVYQILMLPLSIISNM